MGQMAGQLGHRQAVIRATGMRPIVYPSSIDRTAWADVQAIQLLLSTWIGRSWLYA